MSLFPFFNKKLPVDTQKIEQAISHLEQQTSAELRVVVESKAPKNVTALARAEQLFDELNMQVTNARNGVLIYLAFKPHHVAVIGDIGIHEKVGQAFWQQVYDAMKVHLQEKAYTQAICEGITQVSKQLAIYFPYQNNDSNELPNEVILK